jgi:hypothetical protein
VLAAVAATGDQPRTQANTHPQGESGGCPIGVRDTRGQVQSCRMITPNPVVDCQESFVASFHFEMLSLAPLP